MLTLNFSFKIYPGKSVFFGGKFGQTPLSEVLNYHNAGAGKPKTLQELVEATIARTIEISKTDNRAIVNDEKNQRRHVVSITKTFWHTVITFEEVDLIMTEVQKAYTGKTSPDHPPFVLVLMEYQTRNRLYSNKTKIPQWIKIIEATFHIFFSVSLDSANWNPMPNHFSTQNGLTKEKAKEYYGGERNEGFEPIDEILEHEPTRLQPLKTTKEMLEEMISKQRSPLYIKNYTKNRAESYQVNFMVHSPGNRRWKSENSRVSASIKMLAMAAIALQFDHLAQFPTDFVKNTYSKWENTKETEMLELSTDLTQKKDYMGFEDKKNLGTQLEEILNTQLEEIIKTLGFQTKITEILAILWTKLNPDEKDQLIANVLAKRKEQHYEELEEEIKRFNKNQQKDKTAEEINIIIGETMLKQRNGNYELSKQYLDKNIRNITLLLNFANIAPEFYQDFIATQLKTNNLNNNLYALCKLLNIAGITMTLTRRYTIMIENVEGTLIKKLSQFFHKALNPKYEKASLLLISGESNSGKSFMVDKMRNLFLLLNGVMMGNEISDGFVRVSNLSQRFLRIYEEYKGNILEKFQHIETNGTVLHNNNANIDNRISISVFCHDRKNLTLDDLEEDYFNKRIKQGTTHFIAARTREDARSKRQQVQNRCTIINIQDEDWLPITEAMKNVDQVCEFLANFITQLQSTALKKETLSRIDITNQPIVGCWDRGKNKTIDIASYITFCGLHLGWGLVFKKALEARTEEVAQETSSADAKIQELLLKSKLWFKFSE